jgi:hypothetical protein
MSMIWKRVPNTVRPRSSGRAPVLLCLVVFGLTAVVVYRGGRMNWTPANPNLTYTATAYVVPRLAGHSAGDSRIPIQYTDDNSQHAAATANAVAERYVDNQYAEWKRRTEGSYRSAREAADKARRGHAENTAQLEAFRRELSEAAEPRTPSPTTIENPQWTALDHQLGELQQQRDKLLVTRTPLHPAVQDLDTRIKGVKDQLATTQREIPGPDTKPRPVVAQDTKPQPVVAPADQEKLDALTAAVATSQRACEKAESVEKKAEEMQHARPRFAIEYAEVVENPALPDFGWRRLMWTTLAGSVLMAFGVGSASWGAKIEPPAASLAEVQGDTGVPVVGMIPADDPFSDPTAASRRQSRRRRLLVAIGLILMAACPVLVVWGVAGI